MSVLVPFECRTCKAVVYAPSKAMVGHVCRSVKPRPKFMTFTRREDK